MVVVHIAGTPTTADANSRTITTAASIPANQVQGASAAVSVTGTVTIPAPAVRAAAGNGKADGAEVVISGTGMMYASTICLQFDIDDLRVFTLPNNPGNQTLEYAISVYDISKSITPAPHPDTWQDSTVFSGLLPDTFFHMFARSKENATHNAGPVYYIGWSNAMVHTPYVKNASFSRYWPYPITANPTRNGSYTINDPAPPFNPSGSNNYIGGELVTINVTPDPGYVVGNITVIQTSNPVPGITRPAIPVTTVAPNSQYTFTTPAPRAFIQVSVTFVRG
jgi:hypothetical protein